MSEVNGKTVTQDFSLSGPFWIWELPGSGHTGPNSPQLCSGLHPATNYTVLWETSHVSSLMTPRLTDPPPHPTPSPQQMTVCQPTAWPDFLDLISIQGHCLWLVLGERASSWIQNWGEKKNQTPLRSHSRTPDTGFPGQKGRIFVDFCWRELGDTGWHKFLPGAEGTLSWPIWVFPGKNSRARIKTSLYKSLSPL